MGLKNLKVEKFNDYLNTAYNLDSEDNITCYLKGKHLRNQGNVKEAEKLLEGAFDRWKLKFDQNRMNSWDYSWFLSCARALGKNDFAKIIESAVPNKTFDLIYNVENLTQLQQEKGLNK